MLYNDLIQNVLFISVCIDAAQAEAAVAPFSATVQGNKQPQQQSVSVNTRCVCLQLRFKSTSHGCYPF